MKQEVTIPIYQVDAFADQPFRGNPAAVCVLDEWLPAALMQQIAAENNLSETAFTVREANGWRLRWFTPETEIDLCGHATLATAFVLFATRLSAENTVCFATISGPLVVQRDGELLTMTFPARPGTRCTASDGLLDGLGIAEPVEIYKARDYMIVLPDEAAVRALRPDFSQLSRVDAFGIIVTAPGDEADFVSRYFAPGCGVPEDPVTGSAHCTLVPYWAARLGKTRLNACQVSKRSGWLQCEHRGEQVTMAGTAVLYMEGCIRVPAEVKA